MMQIVIVGAGEVVRKHWGPVLAKHSEVRVVGIIEPDHDAALGAAAIFPSVEWIVNSIEDPKVRKNSRETVALVLTPDHLPTIHQLVAAGFTSFMVEKPLVSRATDVPLLRQLVDQNDLHVFSVDQYIPKTLPLQVVLGVLASGDPRRKFIRGEDAWSEAMSSQLGVLEGVSVTILESGNFCLPDLRKRQWLRDPEIGGMLRDLGTHAFAPLFAAGLRLEEMEVRQSNLASLAQDDETFIPLKTSGKAEMLISVLLRHRGIPIAATFGKVPGEGGEWSLTARFANGQFFTGLRSGQSAVVVFNDGRTASLRLDPSPVEYLLQEASLFFGSALPGFDGNVGSVLDSLELIERIRQQSNLSV